MPRFHLLDTDDILIRTVALRSADDFLKHPVVTELPSDHPDWSQSNQVSISYEDTDHHLIDAGAVRMVEAKLGDRAAVGRRWDGERFVDGSYRLESIGSEVLIAEGTARGSITPPAPALPAPAAFEKN